LQANMKGQLRMKAIITLLLVLSAFLSVTNSNALTLAERGKATATIIVGSDATATEKYAANELASYLKQISGADFITCSSPISVSGTKIFVGQTTIVKAMLPDVNWKSLSGDSILIRTKGNNLFLAGDRPRGTLYAVNTFLEDYLGVKWWTPSVNYVPRKSTVRINDIDLTYKPPFMFRDSYFVNVIDGRSEFPVHMRLNGHFQIIPPEQGGHYFIHGFVHTFNQMLPPAQYAKDHPEWYALVNGKRRFENAQLCLTNPEMKAEMIRVALSWIGCNPAAGLISISQNDAPAGACQCEKCQAIVKETGSETGALIAFVNSVAEEIEKQYPGFLVETLAYQYSRKPPTKIKPRKNVIIRLCTIECDFAKPLEGPTNKDFMADLNEWKKISNQLFIWDYVANFTSYIIPMPNFQVLAPNIRTFANNKVTGLYEQGDGYNREASFCNLRLWMIAHLMWNPSLNPDKLMKEYLNGYYGNAGPYLYKYIKVWEKALARENGFHGCGSTRPFYMNADDFADAFDLFEAAEKSVANDPVITERLKIQRLALDHGYIISRPYLKGTGLKRIHVNPEELVRNFLDVSTKTGNDYIGEGFKLDDNYKNRLISFAKTDFPEKEFSAPFVLDSAKAANRLEIQDNEFSISPIEKLVVKVPDSQATDGHAVKESTNHVQWSVSVPLQEYAGKKGEVFASIRVDTKASKGKAFSIGIYDPGLRYEVVDRLVKLESIPGKGYYEYSLGEIEIKPGSYIYIAPCNNPEGADGIYIDRAYIVPSP